VHKVINTYSPKLLALVLGVVLLLLLLLLQLLLQRWSFQIQLSLRNFQSIGQHNNTAHKLTHNCVIRYEV
jgi:hypothetical protein